MDYERDNEPGRRTEGRRVQGSRSSSGQRTQSGSRSSSGQRTQSGSRSSSGQRTPSGSRSAASGRRPASQSERSRSVDPERRAARQRERQRRMWIRRLILIGLALLIALVVALIAVSRHNKAVEARKAAEAEAERIRQEEIAAEEAEREKAAAVEALIAEADQLALGYDYDGAIETLTSSTYYSDSEELQTQVAEYEDEKSLLVAVDPATVTHVFYHSLIVDPELCFSDSSALVAGFKQWMTTVDEFNAITEEMYKNGYVLVSMYDLVEQTVDDNGTVHFTPKTIYLPAGKKAFILSLDDLSYYHSYDNHGIASKIVLDENGKPTCEYINQDGTVSYGAYDCIPLLDAFLEEHPDGAYRGARGTIALTGYDGILGYRTDIAYKTHENLSTDQRLWLEAHPDFDWDAECAEAKKVAEAIKADGWTFASHTWGHLHIADVSLDRLKTDTQKWLDYVAPLVGGTDMIIFAHGQDLAAWNASYIGTDKYEYLNSQGFHIYCNVDSNKYTLKIEDTYIRDGRRNLDGYRLWQQTHGGKDRLSDLFDASLVIDPIRTDMPDL